MSIKDNGGLPKNELIKKLEAISVLNKKALSIKSKMDNFEPEDNYERKIIVPDFPGEYEDEEELDEFKSSVEHEDEDAVEQIAEEYDKYYSPKKPQAPKIKDFEYKTDSSSQQKQQKFGCFSYIAVAIGAFFLIGSFVGVDESTSDTLPVIYGIAAIAAVAFIFFKLLVIFEKKADSKKRANALFEYNKEVERIKIQHNDDMQVYESELASYKLRREDFLDEYSEWRKVFLESEKEESVIRRKLENDRLAMVKKIEDEEFMPVLQDMSELNDLITTDYLPALDIIIDLLKSGRADDLKEAINLYEDIVYRERQLQLERQKEEQRKYEEEQRRRDEERRYQEDKAFRESQERQRRLEEERRRDDEERRRLEEERARKSEELRRKSEEKERIRREEYKAHMSRLEEEQKQQSAAAAQCQACAHAGHCSMKVYNKTPNCTGFTPRR